MATCPIPEQAIPDTPPEGKPTKLEVRLRQVEPQWEGSDAETVDRLRGDMISKLGRWQRSRSIAEIQEAQAYQAAAQYRRAIPRGHWTQARRELAQEFGGSTRDFLRKLARYSPAAHPRERKGLRRSATEAGATGGSAIPKAPTLTERYRAAHAREAASALGKAARAERRDVFARRISGQIQSRYQSGVEHSLTERMELARTILEGLGLHAQDLTGNDASQGARTTEFRDATAVRESITSQ